MMEQAEKPVVTAEYLGGNSIWFNDGATHLMVDPFFTRPGKCGKWTLLVHKVRPDVRGIASYLEKVGIQHLDALLFTHTHYDHILDGAEVARMTDTIMVGSPSVKMVGRGAGLTEERMVLAESNLPLHFGDFTVTFIRATHTPFPFPVDRFAGISRMIEHPIKPPAHILAYKDGGVYCLFIDHPGAKVLVCGSGGFIEGELQGFKADTVLMCVGGLDLSTRKHREQYMHETAVITKARRIYFTHWDDFSRPLSEESRLAPWTRRSVTHLTQLAERMGVETGYMPREKKITL